MKRLFIGLFAIVALLVVAPFGVQAAVDWDLSGTYTIEFTCTSGCSGTYEHSMTIDTVDLESGTFSGTGFYVPNNAYTWDVTGTTDGSDVDLDIVYTGTNSGYTVDVTGVITNDGSMSGTAVSSTGQTFDWATATGNSTPTVNDPETKEECKKGGWADFGFKNQGRCIQFFNTGKDSR